MMNIILLNLKKFYDEYKLFSGYQNIIKYPSLNCKFIKLYLIRTINFRNITKNINIPGEIENLTNLVKLNITYFDKLILVTGKLKTIPTQIGELTNLVEFSISRN
jgi:hypothetical protein